MITNGRFQGQEGLVDLGPGIRHIAFDLEEDHAIYAIVFWHFHPTGHIHKDVDVQVARSPDLYEPLKASLCAKAKPVAH